MEQSEQEQISRKMLEGEYYKDARAWYTALYISPVSERSAFLLIACLAALTFFIGFLGLMDLMPINEKTRLIVPNSRMDSTVMSVHKLKEANMPADPALINLFVANYVYMRESYRYSDYPKHQAFVRAHSDPATLSAYLADYGTSNPKSYASVLGRIGERVVQITGVQVNDSTEPYTATVRFVTDFKKVKGATRTAWTATLSFYYTKLSVNEVEDPSTGELTLNIEDPAFNVVSYAVVPSR